jgi:hypothetical protein
VPQVLLPPDEPAEPGAPSEWRPGGVGRQFGRQRRAAIGELSIRSPAVMSSTVQLLVERFGAPADIETASFNSIAELLREFKARLRQKSPSGELTVSIPSLLRQGLSIPRVFKVLVNAWEQYGPSRPTVVVRVASGGLCRACKNGTAPSNTSSPAEEYPQVQTRAAWRRKYMKTG